MAKYKYDGESELYFSGLGLTVQPGDTFEGPDGLSAFGLTVVTTSKTTPAPSESESETN